MPRLSALVMCALCAPTPAQAQFGQVTRDGELDSAESSGRVGSSSSSTRDRRPGTHDPYDHAAYLRIGFGRTSSDVALGGSVDANFLPLVVGTDFGVGEHAQLRGRFGVTGAVTETSGIGTSERERTFRPGNLSLGGYYLFGLTGRRERDRHQVLYTVGVGGQLALPTAQEDGADGEDRALALFGAYAVNGLEDSFLFTPETLSVVPGAFLRFGYGPLFANASLDFAVGIATNDASAVHALQLRVEAGYRGMETLRAGLGFTHASLFGGADAGQNALRFFVRADLKAVTLGTEFVLNLDSPFGFSFDSGRTFGLVSTAGISL